MDAFYASVEQRDNPELKGKPVAVGGSGERGVVAAASYEARKYGVHSAMPSVRATKICPKLIFVKPRFEEYKRVSHQIRDIFREYTDLIEPLSLDEAYLDVTKSKLGPPSATLIAQEIKGKIAQKVNLTASAGISYCKFLAKIASDMNKPNGLYVILPEHAEEFLENLPIKKFHGIGKVTAEKMKLAGIFTGKDLKYHSREDLIRRYGKVGSFYYNIVRGIDERAVNPERERKSVSAERTYQNNLYEMDEIEPQLIKLVDEVYNRITKVDKIGKTVTLKVKYSDFQQITRSKTDEISITSKPQFLSMAKELFTPALLNEKGIRLLGLGISNFKESDDSRITQLTLSF